MMHDSPADARQEIGKAPEVHQAGRSVSACGFQQDMVRLVPPEHVKDEIGRDRHRAGFLFHPRKPPLDQPRDHGAMPERALHQRTFREPVLEIISEHVGIKEIREKSRLTDEFQLRVAQHPDRDGVIVGDETERLQPGALHAARQQHAERLVCQPSLEGIGDEIVPSGAREALDK